MDSAAALNRLLAVLTERGIGLGYDELGWLFESPQYKDSMTSWVHEYLSPATLLSLEEHDLHAHILQTNYKVTTTDGMPQPMQETDFENAINTLEASTAAIEKQTAILEAQRNALMKLQALNQEPVSTISESDEKKSSQARTKAQLDLETNELTEVIQQRVGATKRHAESSLNLLKTSSQRQLDKDDRLLDGLQKVMFKLAPLESSETRLPDFNLLSSALVKLEGKIIKDRTNATYIETLNSLAGETDGFEHDDNAQAAQEAYALAEELESLITEVDSVLEMTISRRYRAPIVNALKLSDAQAQLEQQSWLEYVVRTLHELAQKTEDLASCTQDTLAYTSAISHVSDALAQTLPPLTQPPSRLDRKQSVRAPSPKKNMNPILHRQGVKDPALEILGYHGIRIPVESGSDGEVVSQALRSAIFERQSRLQDLQRSTEQSVAAQVAESINMANGELQNLLGVLYAHSPYATVHLADSKAKDRLEHLDHEIEGLGDGIKRLDVDRLAEAEQTRLSAALDA
ncbi:hypothetical protein D6C86_07343 [Aureobasidium pullulans]|uniref:HAUS augmin-like complex subunit 3 N-terminal domain-containing protein n=1 Tax=Aureobasidium pullulans TaxID=5580 RepID=A0A4S9WFC2_AURPU|nr:hypothetical protein D6C94_05076 [Aureobasidium pullulans]THZ41086.1 hypothetical protein D6C87_05955 [Aureobasidium pullulans]THZ57162.1 hypothetical protein D6C86_07343 [Aureobasidium pullulans]THZ64303.1 hypothetical protein D6C88_08427 [Aureobasidium pullulans]